MVVHALGVPQIDLGIHSPRLASNRPHHRCQLARRAHRERQLPRRRLAPRQIDRRRGLAQAAVANVARDAHDGAPRQRVRSPVVNAFPDWIGVRPEPLGDGRAHHGHLHRVLPIALQKTSAAYDRYAEGAEVVYAPQLQRYRRGVVLLRLRQSFSLHLAVEHVRAQEWRNENGRDSRNARDGAESLLQGVAGRKYARHRDRPPRELQDREMAGRISQVEVKHPLEAAREQPGARQQNERERDLRCHERLADVPPQPALVTRARVEPERRCKIRSSRGHGWQARIAARRRA